MSVDNEISYINSAIHFSEDLLKKSGSSQKVKEVTQVALSKLQASESSATHMRSFLVERKGSFFGKCISLLFRMVHSPVFHSERDLYIYQANLKQKIKAVLKKELLEMIQEEPCTMERLSDKALLVALLSKVKECGFLLENERFPLIIDALSEAIPKNIVAYKNEMLFMAKAQLSTLIFLGNPAFSRKTYYLTIPDASALSSQEKDQLQTCLAQMKQTICNESRRLPDQLKDTLFRLEQAEGRLRSKVGSFTQIPCDQELLEKLEEHLSKSPILFNLPVNGSIQHYMKIRKECCPLLTPSGYAQIPEQLAKSLINRYLDSINDKEDLSLLELNHIEVCLDVLEQIDPQGALHQQSIRQKTTTSLQKIRESEHLSLSKQEKLLPLLYLTNSAIWCLSSETTKILSDLLLSVIRSPKESVQYCKQMLKTKKAADLDVTKPLDRLRLLALKANSFHSIESALKLVVKAEFALSKTTAEELLSQKSKLTLQELEELRNLRDMYVFLHSFGANKGGKEEWGELIEIFAVCKKACDVCSNIEKKATEEMLQTCPSGTFFLSDAQKKLSMRKGSLCLEERLSMFFIHRYVHAAKVYIPKGGTIPKLSHVIGVYQNNKIGLKEITEGVFYRIHPEKLINNSCLKALQRRLSPTEIELFLKKFSAQYQEIERHIHEDLQKRFSTISNDDWRRYNVALAQFGLSQREFSKKQSKEELDKLLQDVLKEENALKNANMACSEFASKMTVVALVELEKWFIQELKKIGIDTTEALDIPIGGSRRYETIHPGEIITLFSKKGALERVRPSPTLSKMLTSSADE